MSTEGNYFNGDAAEAANALLQQIATSTQQAAVYTQQTATYTAQHEKDLVYTAVVPVFYTNAGVVTQYYSREKIVYDNISATELSRVTEYSTDAATWTTTVPTGTPAVGTPPITVGIEQGIAPVGEVLTAGVVTGKVFVVLTTPEDSTVPVPTYLLVNTNGTFVYPYSGVWQPVPDVELDLIYTNAIPVCFDNAGVNTQYYTRTRAVFNNETNVENSVVQYSSNGSAWSAVTPAGVPTVGLCAIAAGVELDVVYTDAVKLCVNNVGVFTTWYARQAKTVNNATGLVTSTVTEYSTDGATWSVTVPAGVISAGDCVAPAGVELDLVQNIAYICVTNANVQTTWMVRQSQTVNNTTGLVTGTVTEYSTDGATWSATVPAGTIAAGACDIVPVTETAGGTVIIDGATFTIPANAISFTVTAQSGSFDLSFDGGGTFALTGRVGSRTYGQGTINTIANSGSVVVLASNPGNVDIIWEL